MNTYNAILSAADRIEERPDEFNFGSIEIPDGCGSPGCAIGWIAYYRDDETLLLPLHGSRQWGENKVLPVTDYQFYSRMGELAPGWTGDATACARALRQYAHKYHDAPKPMPNTIRAIFEDAARVSVTEGRG